jgi:hypothetical protein
MHGLRNQRARARARLLLEAPLFGDADLPGLQPRATRFHRDIEGWETETAEPNELISTALDAVARDRFERLFGTAGKPSGKDEH